MPNQIRTVRVERNRLRFAAAHMATFEGRCEPLHGHNYDVMVEVEGELAEESWLIDFGRIKGFAREICDRLDHHFLLQRKSTQLLSELQGEAWILRFEGRQYRFPAQDVFPLPIDNSTAERLSEWIHAELAGELQRAGASNLRSLSVGVEEMPGQAAWYTAPIQ